MSLQAHYLGAVTRSLYVLYRHQCLPPPWSSGGPGQNQDAESVMMSLVGKGRKGLPEIMKRPPLDPWCAGTG